MNYNEVLFGDNKSKFNLTTLPYDKVSYMKWRTDHANNDFVSCDHSLFDFDRNRQKDLDQAGEQFFYQTCLAPTKTKTDRTIKVKFYIKDIKWAYKTILHHLFGKKIRRYRLDLKDFMLGDLKGLQSQAPYVDLVGREAPFFFDVFAKSTLQGDKVKGYSFLDVLNLAHLIESATSTYKKLHNFKNSEEVKLYVLAWFQMHNDYLVLASEHVLLNIVNNFVFEHNWMLTQIGEMNEPRVRKEAVFNYLKQTDTIKYLDRPYV